MTGTVVASRMRIQSEKSEYEMQDTWVLLLVDTLKRKLKEHRAGAQNRAKVVKVIADLIRSKKDI